MSTHNICFCGEIREKNFLAEKKRTNLELSLHQFYDNNINSVTVFLSIKWPNSVSLTLRNFKSS